MKKLGLVPTLILGLILAVPASAQATTDDAVPVPAATCPELPIENPFEFDGDPLDYVLAPDGSFEEGASGWLLEGGAATSVGNDPFPIREGDDDAVLSIPPGGTATSPAFCVDLNYPTFRFALQQLSSQKGRLKVETLYPDSTKPKWRKTGAIRLRDDGWVLSDHLELAPDRGGSEPGARQVALRFTFKGADVESGSGAFEIDDVYVDPRFRV